MDPGVGVLVVICEGGVDEGVIDNERRFRAAGTYAFCDTDTDTYSEGPQVRMSRRRVCLELEEDGWESSEEWDGVFPSLKQSTRVKKWHHTNTTLLGFHRRLLQDAQGSMCVGTYSVRASERSLRLRR